MNRNLVAAIANNVAAALSKQIVSADAAIPTFTTWSETDPERRQKVLAAVNMLMDHPDKTPEDAHADWVAQRVADGWAFGETADEAKKQHPLVRPWAELPIERRVQDTVFHAIVVELKNVPDAPLPIVHGPITTAPVIAKVPGQHVPVKYIGKRPFYRDGAYQTGITFQQGETKPVPADKAALMLRHADVYTLGEMADIVTTPAPAEEPAKPAKADQQDDQDLQDARMQVERMEDKDSVASFILANFGQQIDGRIGLAKAKAEALRLIDQLGLAK